MSDNPTVNRREQVLADTFGLAFVPKDKDVSGEDMPVLIFAVYADGHVHFRTLLDPENGIRVMRESADSLERNRDQMELTHSVREVLREHE